jgi:transcriptional regulator with XRE-family HTH domain
MTKFSFPTEKEAPGETLRLNRENKKIKLEEAASHLRIKKEYLIALENDEYDKLPSGLYGKQFLKKYCQLLRLNYKKMLANTPLSEKETENNPFSQKILKPWNLLVFPKLFRNILLIILFIFFILYLLFYFRGLSSAPKLIVKYPDKNLVTEVNNLEIKGETDPETEVIINGNSIISSEDGSFIYEIRLKSGLNNINIIAKKKHGRETLVQRQILVEEKYD